MTHSDVALDVVGLRVAFGASKPVKGISFTVHSGERIGIVGESGSGKSLTALSIMGLARRAQVSGQALLNGRDLLSLKEREMQRVRGGQVAMVYQDPISSLNPVLTIGTQLVEAIRLHSNTSRSQAKLRAVDLLEEVGVSQPARRVEQYPHEFSGGMLQRVVIAMAMSAKPLVLLADEPTTALDVTTQSRVIDLLDRLADDHGTAVVLITHDLGIAAGFCESINVMREGEIVEAAVTDDLYRDPQHPYTQDLLSSVVDLKTDVNSPIPCSTSITSISDRPQQQRSTEPDPRSTKSDILVRTVDLVKTYGIGSGQEVRAVDGVSLNITKGQTFGLVGESGCGKSTISRAVLGLTNIDEGRVFFEDTDIHAMSNKQIRPLRKRMQMVFQDPFASLNRRHTVAQVVTAPLRAHGIGNRTSRVEMVEEALDLVGLGGDYLNRTRTSMSGGQCQRVSLARALVLRPEFLVLDEPVSSLDVSIQAQVLNLLRELQDRLGLTYLFISHDLAVVRYLAHEVAVMKQGVIVEHRSREDLFANPEHPYTQSLMAAVPIADPIRERQRRRDVALADSAETPAPEPEQLHR